MINGHPHGVYDYKGGMKHMAKKLLLFFALSASLLLVLFIEIGYPKEGLDKISLEKPLPLSFRYKVGETLYYRLVRQNNQFKLDGTKAGEFRAVAYFTRTRIEDDNQGRVREKFTWKSFASGMSLNPSQPLKLAYFKEGEDFSLILSVQDEDAIFKLDFSQLPRTMDGLWFMIMSWDAITFDGPARPSKYFLFPDKAPVGAEIKETRGAYDFPFEFPPLLTDCKYSFSGKSSAKILGVSLIKNIPCAIIEFSQSENVVSMNLRLKPVELKSHGFEHFWGKTYLSLQDGRIVRGELSGPVVLVQDFLGPGKSQPERSELFIFGIVELDLITAEKFSQEIEKQKEISKN